MAFGRTLLFSLVGAVMLAIISGNGSLASEPSTFTEEPVDLVVDLVIEEAWTMAEMAEALTEKTGVPFVLAPGIDPHKRMRDPYTIMSFQQNLKEHLNELEEWGLWSFTWQDGKYVINEL